jgi:hypothetical protein
MSGHFTLIFISLINMCGSYGHYGLETLTFCFETKSISIINRVILFRDTSILTFTDGHRSN